MSMAKLSVHLLCMCVCSCGLCALAANMNTKVMSVVFVCVTFCEMFLSTSERVSKSGVRLLVFWCESVDAVGEQGGATDPDVVAFAHGIGGYITVWEPCVCV